MMMTPSGRRSTAMSRSSHWILRNEGFVGARAAAWTFIVLSQGAFLYLSLKGRGRIASSDTSRVRVIVASPHTDSHPDPPPFRGREKSARRHPYRAVEANGLAVDHRIFDDVHGKRAVFRGIAEPRRMRHLGAETLPRLFVQAHQERG